MVQRRIPNSEDSSSDFGDVDEDASNYMEMTNRIESGAPGRVWRASARMIDLAGRLTTGYATAMFADIAELTMERLSYPRIILGR